MIELNPLSKTSKRFLALLLLGLLVSWGGLASAADTATAPVKAAKSDKATKTVKLLTVGNSFSRNATRYLNDIVAAAGHKLVHRPIIVGGASFTTHWEKVELFEKDPTDPKGSYGPKQSLKELLESDAWEYVTIQQNSLKSHNMNTYQPDAGKLAAYIKKYAPQAQLLIHQTWAYRMDDPRFRPTNTTPGDPKTQEEMYQGLTRSYDAIAEVLEARVIPVGDAFHLADTDNKWGYRPDAKYDFKSPLHTSLPDQTHSLHVGYKQGKGEDGKFSLSIDGHHANTAGEYLGACVFFEFLYGENVVGNAFVPKGLDADYARFLQETAHRAVAARKAKS